MSTFSLHEERRMLSSCWVINMPRTARLKSVTNIYHVIWRGINKQVIFEDDSDRYFFMNVVRKCKEVSGFKLYAFCLMTNHVHMLIQAGDEPLEIVFRRIGSSYVKWYNQKYERTGHLFQDRYRSENVENERYFMTVLRYILQNPMKAGMESSPGKYKWTSYRAYEKGIGSITDTEYAESIFGGRDNLLTFCKEENDDTVPDEDDYAWRIKDDKAIDIMKQISNCSSVSEFQLLDRKIQKNYVRDMFLEKLSVKQISRITGMPRTTVDREVKRIAPAALLERKSIQFHESDESAFTYGDDEIW